MKLLSSITLASSAFVLTTHGATCKRNELLEELQEGGLQNLDCIPNFCPTKPDAKIKVSKGFRKNDNKKEKSPPIDLKTIHKTKNFEIFSLNLLNLAKAAKKQSKLLKNEKFLEDYGWTVVLNLKNIIQGEVSSANFDVGKPSVDGRLLSFSSRHYNRNLMKSLKNKKDGLVFSINNLPIPEEFLLQKNSVSQKNNLEIVEVRLYLGEYVDVTCLSETNGQFPSSDSFAYLDGRDGLIKNLKDQSVTDLTTGRAYSYDLSRRGNVWDQAFEHGYETCLDVEASSMDSENYDVTTKPMETTSWPTTYAYVETTETQNNVDKHPLEDWMQVGDTGTYYYIVQVTGFSRTLALNYCSTIHEHSSSRLATIRDKTELEFFKNYKFDHEQYWVDAYAYKYFNRNNLSKRSYWFWGGTDNSENISSEDDWWFVSGTNKAPWSFQPVAYWYTSESRNIHGLANDVSPTTYFPIICEIRLDLANGETIDGLGSTGEGHDPKDNGACEGMSWHDTATLESFPFRYDNQPVYVNFLCNAPDDIYSHKDSFHALSLINQNLNFEYKTDYHYPSNFKKIWQIAGPANIKINHFNVEFDEEEHIIGQACQHDHVKFLDGAGEQIGDDLCGKDDDLRGLEISFDEEFFYIYFESDQMNEDLGWVFEVKEYAQISGVTEPMITETMVVEA